MNEHWEEKRLRALFQTLKPEHERGAPSFAKVWAAAQAARRKDRPVWRGLRVLAAVVLALGLSIFALVFLKPLAPRPPVPAQTPITPVSLSEWQSPTDFLLYPSSEEWLPTTPPLRESLMELEAILPDIDNGGVQ